ncbi:MAG TPA: murein L,D-transpeptidase catalytic domain family protein [Pseudobdellovibrionaceae bacterium]
MKVLYKKSFISLILLMPVFPILTLAHSGISQLKEGDVLELQKRGRNARVSPNFSKHNKSNLAFGSDSRLGPGTLVRYTGKYEGTKQGNFGIQVEILPQEGKPFDERHRGKLVWIYYRNHERSIVEKPGEVATGPINPADITEEKNLIRPDESPEDFSEKNSVAQTEDNEVPEVIQEAQNTLDKIGKINSGLSCTNSTCREEDNDSARPLQATDALLNYELGEALTSSWAQEEVLKAGIPSTPLLRALHFYNANKDLRNLQRNYLVVADLTQASNKKRMYKIDLRSGKVSKYTTSHGRGYGNAYYCANTFGNRRDSNLSSGGGYVTGPSRSFRGSKALNLHGVEVGKNDRAFSRGVLLHRASYVNDHQAGRTWGCLSIADKYSKEFISSLEGHGSNSGFIGQGSAIYVYPDRDDILNKNSYWDPSCRANLNAQGDRYKPRWIP